MEKICPKCNKRYNYIERRLIGRKIYIYTVHYENSRKKRCLIAKRVCPEIIETELRTLLNEARRDREVLLRVIKVIIEFLSSIT